MAIPDYQTFMLPFLRLASDGQQHTMREAFETLADEFALTEQERTDLLPSGRQPTFENRVGWAKTSLKKAGLLDSPKRGVFQVTQAGLKALEQAPPRIDRAFLMQYPAFVEFQKPRQDQEAQTDDQESEDQSGCDLHQAPPSRADRSGHKSRHQGLPPSSVYHRLVKYGNSGL